MSQECAIATAPMEPSRASSEAQSIPEPVFLVAPRHPHPHPHPKRPGQISRLQSFRFGTYFVGGLLQDFPALVVQRNLNAGDLLLFSEVSTELINWCSIEDELLMVESANQGNGREFITLPSTQPTATIEEKKIFFRLLIETD